MDRPWLNGQADDKGQLFLLKLVQVGGLPHSVAGVRDQSVAMLVGALGDWVTQYRALKILLCLQDVGLFREVRAAQTPGCPACGPKGDVYAKGERAALACMPLSIPVLRLRKESNQGACAGLQSVTALRVMWLGGRGPRRSRLHPAPRLQSSSQAVPVRATPAARLQGSQSRSSGGAFCLEGAGTGARTPAGQGVCIIW